MNEEPKNQALVIYLARPGATRFADLANPSSRTTCRQIQIGGTVPAELYIQQPLEKTPPWASFFDGFIDAQEFGKNSSTSAALLVEVRGKYFALAFGHGRFLLAEDRWEDRFGLKVALNCIGEGRVRSISKHSLDQLLRHSQEQASRDAVPREFGFDIEQDLLTAVTGTSTDKRFGDRISGLDSLHVSVPVHLNHLPEFLNDVSDKFIETTYRRNYPWVDHIAEVNNPAVEKELNDELIGRINSGERDQTWMAVPEPINWNKVSGFRFPTHARSPEYRDIHLDNFIASLAGQPLTMDLLTKRKVIAVDENGDLVHKWSAYKCLYAELEHGRQESFVLSGGGWYQVKTSFVQEVNSAYRNIPDYQRQFPEYQHDSEAMYLKQVAESDGRRFALMDQQLIQYGDEHSKIEFCDLLTSDHDIIHVKRYGQSGALSHLFAQGAVSGELFQNDVEFRQAVNAKLPETFRFRDPAARPRFDLFQVVFAIVSDRPGLLMIPFFSRLNLKHAVRQLQGYGYRVAKAKIGVEEQFAKLQRFRERKKRN